MAKLARNAQRDRGFMFWRHCEERLVRRSSTSEGGSDEAIHSYFLCCRMDCFAEPVIGRRFAPTRWLAMTLRESASHLEGEGEEHEAAMLLEI
jgi:hypothetical protein